MLYVIYDLDKTSLYCPIALWLDKQTRLKKLIGDKLFYSLYTPAYILELILGLFKVNTNMRARAKIFEDMKRDDIYQIVCTARHLTNITKFHKKQVFKELSDNITLVCVATGVTGLTKVQVLKELFQITDKDEVIMYDDNLYELNQMYNKMKNVSTYLVYFEGKKENVTKWN